MNDDRTMRWIVRGVPAAVLLAAAVTAVVAGVAELAYALIGGAITNKSSSGRRSRSRSIRRSPTMSAPGANCSRRHCRGSGP